MKIVTGMVVKSTKGHDMDSYYIVVDQLDGYFYIADGRRRKLQKPKRKKVSHLLATQTICDNEMFVSNKKIKITLSDFNNQTREVC